MRNEMNAVQMASAGCLAVSLAALGYRSCAPPRAAATRPTGDKTVNSNTKINVDNGGGFDGGSYRLMATGVAIGGTSP